MQQFDRSFTHARLNPNWPLGVGLVVMMGGVGFLVAMMISGDRELAKLWSIGLIPIFIGFGLMLYYFLTRSEEAS